MYINVKHIDFASKLRQKYNLNVMTENYLEWFQYMNSQENRLTTTTTTTTRTKLRSIFSV